MIVVTTPPMVCGHNPTHGHEGDEIHHHRPRHAAHDHCLHISQEKAAMMANLTPQEKAAMLENLSDEALAGSGLDPLCREPAISAV